MTIDPAELAEVKRLAREATPGPWTISEKSWITHDGMNIRDLCFDNSGISDRLAAWVKDADAAFIAHCNPEFVLELVREVERLRLVEEAARDFLATEYPAGTSHPADCEADRLSAALANPAAEAGK